MIDVKYGEWSKELEPKREVKYIVPVNNPMVKAKEAECIEEQMVLLKDTQGYILSIYRILSSFPDDIQSN